MPDFCVALRADVCLVFHASFSGAETVDFSQEGQEREFLFEEGERFFRF